MYACINKTYTWFNTCVYGLKEVTHRLIKHTCELKLYTQINKMHTRINKMCLRNNNSYIVHVKIKQIKHVYRLIQFLHKVIKHQFKSVKKLINKTWINK